jgi:AhpD family alkylhydroperoxidase
MTHTIRVNFPKLAPKAFKSLYDLSLSVHDGLLGARLVELVQLRLSQINGCAYCIDMHWSALIKQDMDPRHINALAGWREAPFFSERERAALLWTDAMTQLTEGHPSDAVYEQVAAQFDESEIAELTLAIVTINAWNRFGVGFAMQPAK